MLKLEPTSRHVIAALLVLLLMSCAAVGLLRIIPEKATPASRPPPTLVLTCAIPVGKVRHVAVSPNGRYVCTVSSDHVVTCYSSSGRRLFSASVPDANRALPSPNGRYTLVYTHLSSRSTRITFLDARGRKHWAMKLEGAVWCADAADSRAGSAFAIGTGARRIYLISLAGLHRRYRRWRTAGAVVSVNFGPRGRGVTYGTWQRSAVAKTSLTGDRIWQIAGDPAGLQHVEALSDRDRVMLRSAPNCRSLDAAFALLGPTGAPIWRGTIDQEARVLCSPDGRYVCVGRRERIRHQRRSVLERHATLFDAYGHKLWDKGSMFFAAEPLLVTSSGHVVVTTDDTALYLIGPTGHVQPSVKLPSRIVETLSSRDGSRIFFRCVDGKVRILRVSG